MIPRFSLVRPTQLDAAIEAFAATDEEGTYYAGGTELLQVMKAGFAQFPILIDLKRIPELRSIGFDDDGWLRIGAAVTHREIERSADVRAFVPALPGLLEHVANVRVRNTGTLGGNLAFAEPHSDPATFLLACGAEVELAGSAGQRRVGIDELIIGPLMTSREPDEILTAIHIPPAAAGVGRAYRKMAFFERPAASVGARLHVQAGQIAEAVVTLGSMTDMPIVVDGIGARLNGVEAVPEALANAAHDADDELGAVEIEADINGSADFKRHLVSVLLDQALQAALVEALARE